MYTITYADSPLIHCMWYAREDRDGRTYDDPANEFWSLGFARHQDGTYAAELYGPSLQPRILKSCAGEEYWGVEFNVHMTLKGLGKGDVLDSYRSLPIIDREFLLGTDRYEIPEYDELERFVQQLEAEGVLRSDSSIYQALNGDAGGLLERTRQRRFKAITGLTKKQIEQLQRARHAYYLLQGGRSAVEAALEAGYADQSHMIRAFRKLRGQTPARILSAYLKKG